MAKTMWTADDYKAAREGSPEHVRVFEWVDFFPRQVTPAFSDHGDNCRCPEHK